MYKCKKHLAYAMRIDSYEESVLKDAESLGADVSHYQDHGTYKFVHVVDRDGVVEIATVGDWIVKRESGEMMVIPNHIFVNLYTLAK